MLISCSSHNFGKKKCKDDGRLRVSCQNVPNGIESKNIELTLFLNSHQILNELNFESKSTGFFVQTEDSYWPAGFYDAQLNGLYKRNILMKNVEIRSGVFTFLTFDYDVLSQIEMNSAKEQPLVVEWKYIAPKIGKSQCTTKWN